MLVVVVVVFLFYLSESKCSVLRRYESFQVELFKFELRLCHCTGENSG